ncbi:MAG: hypothetical protein H8E03_00410 [Pelagibacteraceae bacterium]|nr:hypothetical protein [Pelagibacteraceae bacterium]
MRKLKWSNYAKYIVLADESNGTLLGNYETFLNFRKVVEVLTKVMSSQKTNIYMGEGAVVVLDDTGISPSDATNILSNIDECIWNQVTSKILQIASVMKLKI